MSDMADKAARFAEFRRALLDHYGLSENDPLWPSLMVDQLYDADAKMKTMKENFYAED